MGLESGSRSFVQPSGSYLARMDRLKSRAYQSTRAFGLLVTPPVRGSIQVLYPMVAVLALMCPSAVSNSARGT